MLKIGPKMMTLCAAMTALALVAPLSAQNYNPQEVKKSVTTADLTAIVGSLGHEVIEIDDAEKLVIARDQDGINYFLFGTACDVGGMTGCQGIMMQVR